MYHTDQAELPGGSIGSEETTSRGTRWLAPGCGDDAADRTLERTSVRHGPGGWYVITAASRPRRGERSPHAICRCGPFGDWRDAERALMTSTGAPETNLGLELSDEQTETVDAIMREGLKKRLLDACGRWARASGQVAESRALAGRRVPPDWRRQPQLEDTASAEGRRLEELHEEVTAACAALQQWRTA